MIVLLFLHTFTTPEQLTVSNRIAADLNTEI